MGGTIAALQIKCGIGKRRKGGIRFLDKLAVK